MVCISHCIIHQEILGQLLCSYLRSHLRDQYEYFKLTLNGIDPLILFLIEIGPKIWYIVIEKMFENKLFWKYQSRIIWPQAGDANKVFFCRTESFLTVQKLRASGDYTHQAFLSFRDCPLTLHSRTQTRAGTLTSYIVSNL